MPSYCPSLFFCFGKREKKKKTIPFRENLLGSPFWVNVYVLEEEDEDEETYTLLLRTKHTNNINLYVSSEQKRFWGSAIIYVSVAMIRFLVRRIWKKRGKRRRRTKRRR